MALQQHQGGWMIVLSFAIAVALTIMPLPDWGVILRPEWMAMTLIYWCIALPDRIGVLWAWVAGLILDVASGSLLGQNALAFGLLAYLSIKLHLRIRVYPIWQQALSIMVLIALYQLLTLWIRGSIGHSIPSWAYWYPTLTSMLMWPLVFLSLRTVRRQFRVH